MYHPRTLRYPGILLVSLTLFTARPAEGTRLSFPAPVDAHAISGRVLDADGHPIAQATVRVVDLQRAAKTGDDGRYVIPQIAPGTYTVSFTVIGYGPQVRRVTIGESDVTLDVTLKPSVIELPAIQVTASPTATSALTSPQPISVIGEEELAKVRAPNLGEALEGVAGVHNFSTGVGIGKPVIRGLTNNRVLMLDDGQRLEGQQWGDEHTTSVEAANAARIEVIRGPASVLYGSDALGGVVNVVSPDLPDGIGREPFAQGSMTAGFASGNRQPDGNLTLEGASGGFGFRVSGTGRNSENVRTPDYELWNSGNRNVGGSGALGYRGTWGSISGRYTYRDDKIQLTDEDPDATPYQRIADHRGRVDLSVPVGGSRLDLNGGFEQNRRREFEEAAATDVALGLLQRTYTSEARLHHPSLGPFSGTIGVAGEYTTFTKFGEETLIPDSRAGDAGVYVFEQTDVGRWNLSFGGRYDYRKLNADADADLGSAAQSRNWNSGTGNVGILFHATEPVALVLNVGRGFRAPSAFDLFSNGVHEGTLAFVRGNPDLLNETSLNTDVGLRLQTSSAVAEIGGFVNLIQHFIFTVPTTEIDSASGFSIFDVSQGDARLVGFEAQVEYHPTDYLHLQGAADYVHGQNTTTDEPLPAMPPLRATYTARLEGRTLGALSSPYFSIGAESNMRQTRLNPAEAAFFAEAFEGAGYQSNAYTLVNVSAGFSLPTGGGRRVQFDVRLRNAFNTAWADYLSRVKTNALNPGMGRSVIARMTADF